MKHCLRDAKGRVGYFTNLGEIGLVVDGETVELTVGRGLHFPIAREVFDHLIDEYIGADAIRAYVAKHEARCICGPYLKPGFHFSACPKAELKKP